MLRAAGLSLITLAEHYGVPADESVADEDWLRLAGERGWAVFMKDTRIRNVRCFCLSSQSLSGERMAARFLDNLGAIVAACADEGPFIYVVHAHRIERRPVDD